MMVPLWQLSNLTKKKKFGFRVRIILQVTQKTKDTAMDIWHVRRWFSTQNRTTYDWVVKDQQTCKTC